MRYASCRQDVLPASRLLPPSSHRCLTQSRPSRSARGRTDSSIGFCVVLLTLSPNWFGVVRAFAGCGPCVPLPRQVSAGGRGGAPAGAVQPGCVLRARLGCAAGRRRRTARAPGRSPRLGPLAAHSCAGRIGCSLTAPATGARQGVRVVRECGAERPRRGHEQPGQVLPRRAHAHARAPVHAQLPTRTRPCAPAHTLRPMRTRPRPRAPAHARTEWWAVVSSARGLPRKVAAARVRGVARQPLCPCTLVCAGHRHRGGRTAGIQVVARLLPFPLPAARSSRACPSNPHRH
jgi:hypothetical protein